MAEKAPVSGRIGEKHHGPGEGRMGVLRGGRTWREHQSCKPQMSQQGLDLLLRAAHAVIDKMTE